MRAALALLSLLAAVAVVAIGCRDGSSSSASSSAAAPPPSALSPSSEEGSGTLIAVLGDSIAAGSPLWDPDPRVRSRIGPALDERSQLEYWASKEEPAIALRNCGVFGERTDEIASRLDDCAEGADALIVQGGINDIAQGVPVSRAAANIDSIVHRAAALGLPVAIAEVLPWNNGHPRADRPIAALNRSIAAIADSQDVPVLPFHAALEDPERPGTMRPDLTIDGDHPSIAGYRLLARRSLGALRTLASGGATDPEQSP